MSPVMRVLAAVLFAAALSSTAQASPEQEAANKAAVLAFYEKGLNQKDADAALRYLGDRYVQHNPNAADGPGDSASSSPSCATSTRSPEARSSVSSPMATT